MPRKNHRQRKYQCGDEPSICGDRQSTSDSLSVSGALLVKTLADFQDQDVIASPSEQYRFVEWALRASLSAHKRRANGVLIRFCPLLSLLALLEGPNNFVDVAGTVLHQ